MKPDYIFARSEGLASGHFLCWNAGRYTVNRAASDRERRNILLLEDY